MYRGQSNPQIVLKPQDLVVLLRLALTPGEAPTYATLAAELGVTASEIHAGLERAVLARLAFKDAAGKPAVVHQALKQFVTHAACYAFPAMHGKATRGMPTGYAAPPLNERIVQPNELPPYGRIKTALRAGWRFIRSIRRCPRQPGAIWHCMNCWYCSMHFAAGERANARW